MSEARLPFAHGDLVDDAKKTTAPFYSWFRAVNDALAAGVISDDQATALINALTTRVAALETGHTGDQLLAVMYGTNGITVLGSVASGVEIRGTLAASSSGAGFPGRDGEDAPESWPIPGQKGEPGQTGAALFMLCDDDQGEPWPTFPTKLSDGFLARTGPLNDGTGAASGTLTNAPTAGNPAKWLAVEDAGVTRWLPSWV